MIIPISRSSSIEQNLETGQILRIRSEIKVVGSRLGMAVDASIAIRFHLTAAAQDLYSDMFVVLPH